MTKLRYAFLLTLTGLSFISNAQIGIVALERAQWSVFPSWNNINWTGSQFRHEYSQSRSQVTLKNNNSVVLVKLGEYSYGLSALNQELKVNWVKESKSALQNGINFERR